MKKVMLARLQPRFGELVRAYLQHAGINQKELARRVGIKESHLSNLIRLDPETSSYRRTLSAVYVFSFMRKGVFKMSDIYDSRPETAREEEFWQLAEEMENVELLRAVVIDRRMGMDVASILSKSARLKELGMDVEAVLDGLILALETKEETGLS